MRAVDPNNSLLINVNRQIIREFDQKLIDSKPIKNQKKCNESSSISRSISDSPRFNYNSTLNKRQQSWVDPLEPRIQDTFYHKNLDTLRPTYSILLKKHGSIDTIFSPNKMDYTSNHQNDNNNNVTLTKRSRTPSNWEMEQEKFKLINSSKFGTLKGVTARCLLNIFGVIMFLRMGWMVGQSGILLSIIIILLCSSVTFITTLSMSAIATNGRIEGGGLYYMISRCLGPSFGGTVGILFGIGNAIATSMYLIGFAEVMYYIRGSTFGGDKLLDIRIWSNIALLIETIIALLGGIKLVMRSSMVLLFFIIVVILLIYIGSIYQIDFNKGLVGFSAGFSSGIFSENMKSHFIEYEGIKYNFFKVLAIFFPACTGIMAGANISAQLKNPSVNIPKGTLSAISITTTVYITLVIILGTIVTRDALIDDALILQIISVSSQLFICGVFAATLSAGMTSLTSAPSILKAVVDDNIIPICSFNNNNSDNGNNRGSSGESKIMLIICVFIVFCCNMLGSLNMVAPLITDFYLIAYCIINLSCFLSSMSKSPGWRPSFKYYNKYLALCGTILCIIFMILSDWVYAIISFFISFCLFQYISYIDPNINDWGKVQDSREYYDAFKAVLKLDKQKDNNSNSIHHVKHWRPGFLVLCGDPLHRPYLIHFANTLSKSHSPTFFATIHYKNLESSIFRMNIKKFHEANYSNYLPINKLGIKKKGFFESIFAESFRSGVSMLMQCCGLGNLRPNTIVIGYKHNWQLNSYETHQYIEVIRDALEMGYAIMILRNFSYINWSNNKYQAINNSKTTKKEEKDDDILINLDDDDDEINKNDLKKINLFEKFKNNINNIRNLNQSQNNHHCNLNSVDLSSINLSSSHEIVCNNNNNSSYIDVWWLIDDGGFSVLLPYLMKLHSFWSKCKLRLNIIANSNKISEEYLNVYHLMNSFRLPFEKPNLIEVDSKNEEPKKKTINKFHKLTNNQINFNKDLARPKVIKKWLKISELIHKHSNNSDIIVLTLPLPTRFYCGNDDNNDNNDDDKQYLNGKVYFTILEMLTQNNPPTILIRGNGESALTFYSE